MSEFKAGSTARFVKIRLSEEMFKELEAAVNACSICSAGFGKTTIETFAEECVESVLATRRLANPLISSNEAYARQHWRQRQGR